MVFIAAAFNAGHDDVTGVVVIQGIDRAVMRRSAGMTGYAETARGGYPFKVAATAKQRRSKAPTPVMPARRKIDGRHTFPEPAKCPLWLKT